MSETKLTQYEKLESAAFVAAVVLNNVFGYAAETLIMSKIAILLFFAVEVFAILLRQKISVGKNLIVPILFLFLETLSLLWSYDHTASWKQYVTQLQLFILLMFVYSYVKRTNNINIYLISLYLSGALLAVYTVYVYGLKSIMESLMSSNVRVGGKIANENFFGMVFAQAVIVAFFYLLEDRKKIHILSAIVFTFFAFSSGSKKAVIAILLGILLVVVLKYGIRKMWKGILILSVALFLFYELIQLPVFHTILRRLTLYVSDKSYSDSLRKAYIAQGMKLVWENPFGSGLGSFASITKLGTYSHNNAIELLVSLGIIGFVLFYIPFVDYLLSSLNYVLKKDKVTIIMFVLVLINLIMGYGMVQFYGKGIWILLGVALAHNRNRKSKEVLINEGNC